MSDDRNIGFSILIVASDPLDFDDIRPNIDREVEVIIDQLNSLSIPITITRAYPPTLQMLQSLIDSHEYSIVHFVGHGGSDHVFLETEDGRSARVSAKRLAEVFRASSVELVVLNVCDSENPAERLAGTNVAAVVANSRHVIDEEAIQAAALFYEALARGKSIQDAVAYVKSRSGASATTPFTVHGRRSEQPLNNIPEASSEKALTIVDMRPTISLESVIVANFFNRHDEILRIYDMLTQHREAHIGIGGIPGIGKSALVQAAASRYSWMFPGGVVYTSLEQTKGEFKLQEILIPLGIKLEEGTAEKQFDDALRAMQNNKVLLIIDGLHAMEVKQETHQTITKLVNTWPPSSGGRAILVMERLLDNYSNAVGSNWLVVSPLSKSNTERMLVEKLGRDRINQYFPKSNDVEISIAADLCAGHPMLVDAVIGQLRISVPWETLRLQLENLRSFEGSDIQKVRSVLADTIGRLESVEGSRVPQLLDSWPAFAGVASQTAWFFVSSGEIQPKMSEDWLYFQQAITLMLEANILERVRTFDDSIVWRLPTLVSNYLRTNRWKEEIVSLEQQQTFKQRHVEHFLTCAQDNTTNLRSDQRLNIQHAIELATANEEWERVLDFAISAEKVDIHSGRIPWGYLKDVLEKGLEACQHISEEVSTRLRLRYQLGETEYDMAEYFQAENQFKKGLEEAETAEDNQWIVKFKLELGRLAYRNKEYSVAREIFEEIVVLTVSDEKGLQEKINTASLAIKDIKSHSEAAEHVKNSLGEILASIEESEPVAIATYELGRLNYREAKYPHAQTYLEMSRVLWEKVEDGKSGLSKTLHELARIFHARDDVEQANEFYTNSLTIREDINDYKGQMATLHQLGRLFLDRAQKVKSKDKLLEQAEDNFEQSLFISEARNSKFWIIRNKTRLACVHQLFGDESLATTYATEAHELASSVEDKFTEDIERWLNSTPRKGCP